MARQIVERVNPMVGAAQQDQSKRDRLKGGDSDSSDEEEKAAAKPKKKLSKFAQARLEAAQKKKEEGC